MTETKEVDLKDFTTKLIKECADTLNILIVLGLPYVELQQVVKDLLEGTYTDYLEHALTSLSNDPEYDKKYAIIEKLLED